MTARLVLDTAKHGDVYSQDGRKSSMICLSCGKPRGHDCSPQLRSQRWCGQLLWHRHWVPALAHVLAEGLIPGCFYREVIRP